MGMEHIARDFATVPRRGKDAYLKGVVISREPEKHQRSAWARRICGKRPDVNEAVGVPSLDGEEIIKRCAKAFTNISESTLKLLEDKAS